jgi:hypothetical protein
MRWFNWRRAAALIAIVVGVAVGTTAAPASAADTHQISTPYGGDIWW